MAVLTKILVIFIMIGVGLFLNKIRVLPEESNVYISRLVVTVGTPCLLFDALVRKELTDDTMEVTLQIAAGTVVFFAAATVLAMLFIRAYRLKGNDDRGVYMALMTTINGSFMGFPVMKAAFGNDGLYLMVIANMIFNTYLYSAGVIQIKSGSGERQSIVETVRSVCNPCIIASLLGFTFLLLHIQLPAIIMDPITQIGNITVPLSMLSVGISIGNSRIGEILKDRRLLMVCCTKAMIWPAITFAIISLTDLSVMVKCVMCLMSALPPAVSTGVLVRKLGRNAKLASEGIILCTLLTAVTIPVMFLIISAVFHV